MRFSFVVSFGSAVVHLRDILLVCCCFVAEVVGLFRRIFMLGVNAFGWCSFVGEEIRSLLFMRAELSVAVVLGWLLGWGGVAKPIVVSFV